MSNPWDRPEHRYTPADLQAMQRNEFDQRRALHGLYAGLLDGGAVPVLRELGVRASASRLYNEYRDQVERAHGLPVTSRTVVLWPRVSVSKV